MSVSPKLEKNDKLSDCVNNCEPIKKSSKYVMTCGTPSPPKSPEISTKNAQNTYTSFSISSILSKQDTNEKCVDSKASESTASISLQPPPAFMSHLGGSPSLPSCPADSLMQYR